MKKKTPLIKTKRLLLRPMSDGEMERLMETSDSEELRAAYGEMRSGCGNDPENRVWYAPWSMMRTDDSRYLGDLGFKGPPRGGAVEIGYGVLPEHAGKGYTTEAVQAMTRWAFEQPGVTFVEAETEPDNQASRRILEKCGFQKDGMGKEGPRFVLEAPLTVWRNIYMLFGLSIGTALGASLGNIGVGTAVGLCLGMGLGSALDAYGKKNREKLREQRGNRR